MTRHAALTVLALAWACNGPAVDAPKDQSVIDSPVDTAAPDSDPPQGVEESFTSDGWTARVQVSDAAGLTRSYTLSSDAPKRDGGPDQVSFEEGPDQPVLRSGSSMFDALFALAVHEARLGSVEQIQDGAFNDGQPTPCPCFETGELWTYVWTRDLAYAADLGLAWLDPQRAAASLVFKTSERKPSLGGGERVIVQDTGTGGSWPVSSDRVVWALGARRTLGWLEGQERAAFAALAWEAAVNTLAQDREVVFDPADGLYRGESSFLDWREQSYAANTAEQTVHVGMSKALSTNLAHLSLLRLAAELALELGHDGSVYQSQADALAVAIDQSFWLDELGGYSAFLPTELDPAPARRLDLLGSALAALHLNQPQRGASALANYPHGPLGPPVLWPQLPDVPIYHNRGQWPFVTAYALRAARHTRNAAVIDHNVNAMARGAALNLSNMENFEWFTQSPWFEEGERSGPVVNSRRQLWSVAGYLSMVVDTLFGLEEGAEGLRFVPAVTPQVHSRWFNGADQVTLHGFPVHGERLDVQLLLPEPSGAGAYTVASVTLDGQSIGGDFIDPSSLSGGATLVITLTPSEASAGELNLTQESTPGVAEPPPPALTLDGGLQLTLSGEGTLSVYRDGERVADDLSAGTWTDADPGQDTVCYSVSARRSGQPYESPRSPPVCWWGQDGERVRELSAWTFSSQDGSFTTDGDRAWRSDWGAPEHQLSGAPFTAVSGGEHLLQPVYANGAGGFTTGITAGLKWARLVQLPSQSVVAEGPLLMPHTGSWDRWMDGSFLRAELQAGQRYALSLSDVSQMSALEHFAAYTGGPGGGEQPYGYVDISGVKLLAMQGGGAQAAADFDGVDDIADLPQDSRVTPGVQLESWSAFGAHWTDDELALVLVSSGFEQPLVPWMLYLEVDPGAAAPGLGMEYGGLTPALPFTPTHALSLRRQSDVGDGPWNALWVYDGAWTQRARLQPQVAWWMSADQHTASVRIPRAWLDGATRLRLAGHVVNGVGGQEWKETTPASHTPWSGGGGFYELDLSGGSAASAWVER